MSALFPCTQRLCAGATDAGVGPSPRGRPCLVRAQLPTGGGAGRPGRQGRGTGRQGLPTAGAAAPPATQVVASAPDVERAFPMPCEDQAEGQGGAGQEAPSAFDSIESCLEDIAAGKFVVVLDDEDRENEGDLICAADRVSEEAMAFMVQHTSGVICVSMPGDRMDALDLPLMVSSKENEESMYTAFTVTIDLKEGVTTGISAHDRAATCNAMSRADAKPQEFVRPGHIFPLRYRPGGVLVRPGHTEAAVDLAVAAGCEPAGALCEIVDPSPGARGSMARTPVLLEFAREHGLKCITIADLIRYRLRNEMLVRRTTDALPFPTRHGEFQAASYVSELDGSEHLVLTKGDVSGPGVLTRVHMESTLADTFGGAACEAAGALDASLSAIADAGAGVLVYVRGQAGSKGMSLAAEMGRLASGAEAECSTQGAEAEPGFRADIRDYGVSAHVLRDLGVSSVRLLTNDPAPAATLRSFGVDVQDTLPLGAAGNGAAHN